MSRILRSSGEYLGNGKKPAKGANILKNIWNEYRDNLKKLVYDELLESHITEGKIRHQLEETLKEHGFRMNSLGEWEKQDQCCPIRR